ncbi:MAG: hypothetical protein WCI04_05535 [archaeon]
MKSKIVLFLIAGLIVIVLLGCIATQGSNNSFVFGTSFTAKEGNTYISTGGGVHLTVSNFSDSRCPVNAQCVWAGERGVDVTLYLPGDPSLLLGNLHLGEIMAKTAKTNSPVNYEVELVSIDTDTNTVELIVRYLQTPPIGNQSWLSINPIQCNGNAWDVWKAEELKKLADHGLLPEEPLNDIPVIRSWLSQKYQIAVYDSGLKVNSDVVCDSCTCENGKTIAVLVDSFNTAKMLELGFKEMGAIGCTMDAKICSDGSAVGRTAPFCEFTTCPGA